MAKTDFVPSDFDVPTGLVGADFLLTPLLPKHNDADVRSWVRADHAQLDLPVYDAVSEWLRESWPFERVAYASRAVTTE